MGQLDFILDLKLISFFFFFYNHNNMYKGAYINYAGGGTGAFYKLFKKYFIA